MKKLWIEVKGTSPLLMSAPNPAPPGGDEFTYYKGCFYIDKHGLYLPGAGFEMAVKEARKMNGDPYPQAGVRVLTDRCELFIDSPHDPATLYLMEEHVDRRPVRTGGESFLIARPIFPEWGTELEVAYNENKFNEEQVIALFNDAGFDIGVGGYRQLFGRFEAKKGEQSE